MQKIILIIKFKALFKMALQFLFNFSQRKKLKLFMDYKINLIIINQFCLTN